MQPYIIPKEISLMITVYYTKRVITDATVYYTKRDITDVTVYYTKRDITDDNRILYQKRYH